MTARILPTMADKIVLIRLGWDMVTPRERTFIESVERLTHGSPKQWAVIDDIGTRLYGEAWTIFKRGREV
jgi:hypothetical protein